MDKVVIFAATGRRKVGKVTSPNLGLLIKHMTICTLEKESEERGAVWRGRSRYFGLTEAVLG